MNRQSLSFLSSIFTFILLTFIFSPLAHSSRCSWSIEAFDIQKEAQPAEGFIDTAVVALRNSKGQVLMARRGRESSHSGTLALLGGKIDAGESIEEALMRELYEEARITKVNNLKLEMVSSSTDEQAPMGKHYRVFIFSASLDKHMAFENSEPHKNEQMGWVDLRAPSLLFPPSKSYWNELERILSKI